MPKIVADDTIYRAVMQMVIDRGYGGATTKQIAEMASISEVTLFRKYENKAQLVKQAIVATLEQIDFSSAVQYTGDVAADLLRVVRTYQEAPISSRHFFSIMLTEMPRYPELTDLLEKPLDVFASIGQLIMHYQVAGILKVEPPYHAVAALLGPLITINILRVASTNVPIPPIDLQAYITFFLNGRRHPPSQR
jgi:AcrR family transcriptional regulator